MCIYPPAVRNYSCLLRRKRQSKRNEQLLRRETREVLSIQSHVAGDVNKMAYKKL